MNRAFITTLSHPKGASATRLGRWFSRDRLEALFWVSALAALALANPMTPAVINLCPFDWIGQMVGVDFCPGNGLGHAISFLFHGQLESSLWSHPLGIPVVLGLTHHIAGLLRPRAPTVSRCRK
jgi:hypothetical protein